MAGARVARFERNFVSVVPLVDGSSPRVFIVMSPVELRVKLGATEMMEPVALDPLQTILL